MNVALIMERIEPWRGGAETSTVEFAGHLGQLGCQVTVLTVSTVPSTPALTVVPIKAGAASRAARTLLFARRSAAYVRRHRFDVVHSITPCQAADVYEPRGGTVPEALARNLAIRPAALGRGWKRLNQRLSLKYRAVTRLERRLLARRPPPWVIAISQYVCDQLDRHYQFDAGHVRLIFNGVDPDETPAEERRAHRLEIRRQFNLADDDLVVLCVAHNFKLKGVDKVIEALARRPDQTYVLIVGRDNPASLIKRAGRLGVADRVFVAGPSQRVRSFFHAADLLVHPTFYDPCSRVVLEAMAAGLPVVTTRYNGAAERITDGREGYVIESPHDVAALADRMGRLADDAHRHQCATQAVRTVETISMRRHAAEVLGLYEDIVRSGEGK